MFRFRGSTEFLFLALLLAGLVVLFGVLNEHFWSLATLQSVTNRIPSLALAALGLTFVLVAGGIDLSVGSVSAVAGAVFGWCVADQGIPVAAAAAAALAAGLAGGLAGLAGLCHVARLGAADPNAGSGLELSAIAAAVIGGTSLMGGRGSMLATFVGVLIIATLEAGLAHLGASEPVKRVVTGVVIVGAVGAEAIRARLAARRIRRVAV